MSGRGEQIRQMRRTIWRWYRTHRRILPWRKTRDPYKILVSEIMLQQTQVERVMPFYERFIKRFATAHALAQAPLGEVLTLWSGLGYNRRARYLHEAAKLLQHQVLELKDQPTVESLRKMPGVGEATAAMIASAAFGERVPLTHETNVRQVIHHFFFPGKPRQQERVYTDLAWRLLPRRIPAREWNFAMMDYGALVVRPKYRANRLQITVTKQGTFKNSNRYWRGEIIRRLVNGGGRLKHGVLADIPDWEERVLDLERDQLVIHGSGRVSIK